MVSAAKIEIRVGCRKLPKKDALSQSDAFCILHSVPSGSIDSKRRKPPRVPTKGTEVGRTEVIYDSKKPDFATPFVVDYHFEEEQNYVVRVYDEDKKGDPNLSHHDYLGGTSFSLGQLLGAQGNSVARPLGKGRGYIIIQAEEVSTCRDVLTLQLSGHDLKNTDGMFGKSDPFLAIKRRNPDGTTWSVVWRSSVVKDNLNPRWELAKIPLQTLCNGNPDRPIQIQILDWDSDGTHDDMGAVETTVNKLVQNKNRHLDLMRVPRAKLLGKKPAKKSGTISIQQAEITTRPTMIDYISGGCEINLMVAVDFTASNGAPSLRESLHYRDPSGRPNQYQAAIQKIGTILQDYDTSKTFPMWGFGAVFSGTPAPLFSMGELEEVVGVHGLLGAYKQTFETPGFGLLGPTNFSPVLEAATKHAIQNTQSGRQCYSVLAILTDGVITDMKQTIDMICKVSEMAPLSIVIVGIGNANFSAMQVLDGDDGGRLHNSRGIAAARDIVQFVPFNRFAGDYDELAGETLKEIPDQLVDYFTSKGIKPDPPIPAPEFTEEEIFVSWDDQEEEEICLE